VPASSLARRSAARPRVQVAWLLLAAVLLAGCSVRTLAVNAVADALAAGGDVYASDPDPELVRDALPFALKTVESLLAGSPRHRGLLLAAASGFTQYAYAFPDTDAFLVEPRDPAAARELRARALGLYLRARDYGLRGLELELPGVRRALETAPATALAATGADDVPFLYWTGAAWGAAVGAGKDRPELVADLPAVRALLERALELDEGYGGGAVHGAMIAVEGSAVMGGAPERARAHFERAVALSGGRDAGAYVGLATAVSVPAQDRAEFESLLERALAVDPDADPPRRLANLIAQRRARAWQERAPELFLDLDEPAEDP
jgi:predicted anti-sigma-YlaC factor YlaD